MKKTNSSTTGKLIDFDNFMSKVKTLEKGEKLDLSSDQDLSIAIMNLVSIEEHLFFSGGKTGNTKYYDLINDIREMRKQLLKKIVKEYEGEVWCISKHLLAASMRLMEVGTKMQTKGDKAGADNLFRKGYDLYSLFWGLNLGLVDSSGLSKETLKDEEVHLQDDRAPEEPGETTTLFSKLGQFVKKAIDCCRE